MTIVAPHPDDETLGFAGVIRAGLAEGAHVRVVVTTEGQGFCQACSLWKLGRWPKADVAADQCTRADLAAMAAERRKESARAMEILGLPARDLTFFGFLDGTLKRGWSDPEALLVADPCTKEDTSPAPWPEKHGRDLKSELRALLASDTSGGSVFTTHPRDAHPDHAALYRFVAEAAQATGHPRVYGSIIHDKSLTDCGYPGPAAPSCWSKLGVVSEDERAPLVAENERVRSHFDAWLDPDRDPVNGAPIVFCVEPELWSGAEPRKAKAIEAYRTQRGTIDRSGGPIAPKFVHWIDAEAFLPAFVRRSEVFYLNPAAPP
jgi:LmbE family N-acetylglucosaminyl deacetylase